MEDFGGVFGQIGTIFGFLAFCIAMIWKVVSDKKDNGKIKEIGEKITEILTYITKEKEATIQRQNEQQKQIDQHTKAIERVCGVLEELTSKLAARTKKKTTTKNYKRNED